MANLAAQSNQLKPWHHSTNFIADEGDDALNQIWTNLQTWWSKNGTPSKHTAVVVRSCDQHTTLAPYIARHTYFHLLSLDVLDFSETCAVADIRCPHTDVLSISILGAMWCFSADFLRGIGASWIVGFVVLLISLTQILTFLTWNKHKYIHNKVYRLCFISRPYRFYYNGNDVGIYRLRSTRLTAVGGKYLAEVVVINWRTVFSYGQTGWLEIWFHKMSDVSTSLASMCLKNINTSS